MPLKGGIPIADALAVLEAHKVIVSKREEDDLFIFQTATILEAVPLQAVVSGEMLIWLSDTFNIPLERFYQKRLGLN